MSKAYGCELYSLIVASSIPSLDKKTPLWQPNGQGVHPAIGRSWVRILNKATSHTYWYTQLVHMSLAPYCYFRMLKCEIVNPPVAKLGSNMTPNNNFMQYLRVVCIFCVIYSFFSFQVVLNIS